MVPPIKEPRSTGDERGSLQGILREDVTAEAKRRPVSAAIIGSFRGLASNEGVWAGAVQFIG
jgi:hypothetical protein